jgi:hypothetical protein
MIGAGDSLSFCDDASIKIQSLILWAIAISFILLVSILSRLGIPVCPLADS